MKYRLAGATYRVIAEKLTEERAQAYADEKGISCDIYKHINILEAEFPFFCRQAKAKNSQANGLYVLVGLYLLDQYYLYGEGVSAIVMSRK